MSEPPADEPTPQSSGVRSIAEMLADLTWEQITADGIITLEEIEEMLRAKGLNPNDGYEELYGDSAM